MDNAETHGHKRHKMRIKCKKAQYNEQHGPHITQVFLNDKELLFLIRHPPCYLYRQVVLGVQLDTTIRK